MFDPDYLTPEQAAKLIPSPILSGNGALKPVGADTIRTWIRKGLKIRGKAVRLQADRIGRYCYTKRQWVDEFLEDIERARDDGQTESLLLASRS